MREHLSVVASRKLRWSALGMATVLCAVLLLSLCMTASAQVADGTEIWTEAFESGQGSWAMQNGTWSVSAAPAGGAGSGQAFYDPASSATLWANRAIAAPPAQATRIKASCDFYTASTNTTSSRACLWVSTSNTSGANNQLFRIGTYNSTSTPGHYVCQYYSGGVGTIDTGVVGSIGWHKISIVYDKSQKMVTWKFDNAWGTYANANYGTYYPTYALLGCNVSNGGSANGANVYFDNVKVEWLGAAPGKTTTPSPVNGAANVPTTGATLSWAAVTNAASYDVYLGTSQTSLTKVSSAQPGTSFVAPALNTGANYYWRVDALDGEGNPTMGDVWYFTTPGNFTATCANGLATGSGDYAAGANVAVSVTPNPGYAFMKWSTDPAGTDTVSTLRSLTYTMPNPVPASGITLYAICENRPSVADIIIESRTGGMNFANYSETTNAFDNSSVKSMVSDVTGGIGSRYSSVSETYFGASRYAQYAPNIATAGSYTVWITWPASTNASHYITHEVGYAGGTNFSLWNQNQNAPAVTYGTNGQSPVGGLNNIWNKLGTFPFNTGTTGYVKQYALVPDMIWDDTANPPGWKSTRILADAAKFQYNPPKAINPTPADTGFKVAKANPVLSWQSGGNTCAYDVYFGTNPSSLTKVSSLQGGTTYTCGTLAEATTYYWRVDSVNNGTTTGDVWSFITEGPAGTNYLQVKPNPASFGTATGSGYFLPGATAHVVATPGTYYNFSKWTSDQAGNTQVSTSATFDYTMPAADASLYAQFTPKPYNMTVEAAPHAGGAPTVDGGTSHGYGTPVTVHANVPSDGYYFLNWSKNADGTSVVSRTKDYTFNMPGGDYKLYANYAKALFADGFEGLKSGNAKNHGSLDMNLVGGDNAAASGLDNGNAWWGTAPPNAGVGIDPDYSGAAAHEGSNAAWDGMSLGGRDYVNLAYRVNSGNTFSEKAIYADWWFYDPNGATWNPTNSDYSDDAVSLVYAAHIPRDTDYPSDVDTFNFDESQFAQKISLGTATDWCDSTGTAYTGFDPTKYQARIKVGEAAGQTPYANGWYNLNVARTAGWHHARIVVGDIDWGNYVNPVSFYIDDMSTPALSGTMSPELNALEMTTMWKPTGAPGTPKGAMFDDFTFGYPEAAPAAAPTAGAASAITASGITWNWTQTGTVGGYHVYDAATAGNQKGGDITLSTSYAETGLAANTQYSRWVASFNGGAFESARTALAPAYTLAAVPTSGTNVATTATVGGLYSNATWPGFTNPQGFGVGGKVSSFKYKWSTNASDSIAEGAGTDWSAGTLTATPSADGTYYLYVRSYNAAGVGNGSTKLGAFVFDSTAPTGSVVINNGDASTGSTAVTLTLTANDANIDKMSFSNTNNGTDWSTPEAITATKAWTIAGTNGINTVYVKFTDKAGNSVIVSDTINHETAIPVDKISDLWTKANDSQAYKLSAKAVSGAVSGAFWIEEANRSAAIKVVWSGTPAAAQDHSVDVIGTLSVVGGQRILTASSVTDHDLITDETLLIKPITVVERAAGGKAINANTPSIASGTGLYNIGMLVRIAGNVTASGTGFFYLDDGSGLMDGENMGIKVLCGSVTVPTEGTKTVTGLVGVESGKPVLIIRAAGDIQ